MPAVQKAVVISAIHLWQSADRRKSLPLRPATGRNKYGIHCRKLLENKELSQPPPQPASPSFLGRQSSLADAILTTAFGFRLQSAATVPEALSSSNQKTSATKHKKWRASDPTWHGPCFIAHPTMIAADLAADDGT
jgi:hypothetical protein